MILKNMKSNKEIFISLIENTKVAVLEFFFSNRVNIKFENSQYLVYNKKCTKGAFYFRELL